MAGVVLGFDVHTGWAIRVAVAGNRNRFEILHRARVELLAANLNRFVFHQAAGMELPQAAKLIQRVRESALRSARDAIVELEGTASLHGGKVRCVALFEKKPEVEQPLQKILASHAAIHTAEGVLYRGVLRQAAAEANIEFVAVRVMDDPELMRRVTAVKETIGAPWGAGHRLAAMAALLAS